MYQFIIKKPAKKFMDGLPGNERQRLVAAIEKLPDTGDITPLKGHDGLFRLQWDHTALSIPWTMGGLWYI